MGINEFILAFFRKKDERILRITGSNSLKHPRRDIDFVRETKREVVVAVNEMSLCGADSPLPDEFLRGIRVEREEAVILEEFLNVFQHYLAMLRFDAFLLHLCLDAEKWEERFALYGEKYSQEFLRCFFVKLFPNRNVKVRSFEPLKVENPAPVILGKRENLLGGKLLGKFCTSLNSAMRVEIDSHFQEVKLKFPFKVRVCFSKSRSLVLRSEHSILLSQKRRGFILGKTKLKFFKTEIWL